MKRNWFVPFMYVPHFSFHRAVLKPRFVSSRMSVALYSTPEAYTVATSDRLLCNRLHLSRAVGGLPGVTVHVTEDAFTASLFADELCGVDTSLIFYMQPGSILSRQFTSKDTHSTHGDLLVVHGSAKLRHVDRELAKLTTRVLGFETPSFTFNTDLFLPVGANANLRNWFVSGRDVDYQERPGDWGLREVMHELATIRDMSAVPQVRFNEGFTGPYPYGGIMVKAVAALAAGPSLWCRTTSNRGLPFQRLVIGHVCPGQTRETI